MRILIIEDERGIADTLLYALTTDGMEAEWCATGAEGLRCLASKTIDLVILDIGLPDANGLEICKEIRKTSQVPVLFLTARAGEVDRVVGLEIGADDFVAKPFSPREVSARVKAILRRARPSGEVKAATSLPFVIDPQRKQILYFEKPLELSKYELMILTILVERPGWVFSREQLMQQVWEDPGMSLERTVDAHIKALRAKLRAVKPDIDPIITHRGMGYALKEDW